MSCVACHASWTNTCIGCHLGGEYNTGNNFSNITGERIVFRQANADFIYQTPVPLPARRRTRRQDRADRAEHQGVLPVARPQNDQARRSSRFTDRNGGGNNPARGASRSLSHNVDDAALDPRPGDGEERGPALLRRVPPDRRRDRELRGRVRRASATRSPTRQLRRARLRPAADAHRPEPGQPAQLALLGAHGRRARAAGCSCSTRAARRSTRSTPTPTASAATASRRASVFDPGRVALDLDRIVDRARHGDGLEQPPDARREPEPARGRAEPEPRGPARARR